MKKKVVGVIPARMASSRFPDKPLKKILGMPMIEHVYRRCKLSPVLTEVVVATCDREIRDCVEGFGGRVIMTSSKHERGTDRIAEAASKLDGDIVVNIQGDEPLIHPDMIKSAVAPLLRNKHLRCVNLMATIDDPADFADHNEIKVLFDLKRDALYMSREPVPTAIRIGDKAPRYKQVCVIAFTRETLFKFTRLSPTPLEIAESVDMMRLIENNVPVRMVVTTHPSASVDTPADLAFVEKLMKKDRLAKKYLSRREK
jgi:3-deoxy-manno-octulosonate cytidylyltransferase (CMP-KDO synthetase)